MKMRGALIGAAVVVLVFAGCSSQTVNSAPVATSAARQATPTQAVPTSTPNVTASGDADGDYLLKLKGAWEGEQPYSDSQLIAYGHEVCDKLDAGTPTKEVIVLPGADRDDLGNDLLVRRAILQYCQQYS